MMRLGKDPRGCWGWLQGSSASPPFCTTYSPAGGGAGPLGSLNRGGELAQQSPGLQPDPRARGPGSRATSCRSRRDTARRRSGTGSRPSGTRPSSPVPAGPGQGRLETQPAVGSFTQEAAASKVLPPLEGSVRLLPPRAQKPRCLHGVSQPPALSQAKQRERPRYGEQPQGQSRTGTGPAGGTSRPELCPGGRQRSGAGGRNWGRCPDLHPCSLQD